MVDYFQLANKLSDEGKSEQAIEAYEKALELEGAWKRENWNIHYKLFLECYKYRYYKKAWGCSQNLDVFEDINLSADYYAMAANTCFKLGDTKSYYLDNMDYYKEGLNNCEKALKIDNSNDNAKAMVVKIWPEYRLLVNKYFQNLHINYGRENTVLKSIITDQQEILEKMNAVKEIFANDISQLQTELKMLFQKIETPILLRRKNSEKYAGKGLLESVREAGILIEQINEEILLDRFFDCFIWSKTVSFENYGYVTYSLEEDSDVDENTRERANTWNSEKVIVGKLQNDDLRSMVNKLKRSLKLFIGLTYELPK